MTDQQVIAICASQMLAANAEYIRLQQTDFPVAVEFEFCKEAEFKAIQAAKRIFENS